MSETQIVSFQKGLQKVCYISFYFSRLKQTFSRFQVDQVTFIPLCKLQHGLNNYFQFAASRALQLNNAPLLTSALFKF